MQLKLTNTKRTAPMITVVVCTYNRANLLFYTLKSLATQIVDKSVYQVLVVNNNSNDKTEEVVNIFISRFSNFRIINEYSQGLSHARNRGYKESLTQWVVYMDDDARAPENYIQRILYIINSTFANFEIPNLIFVDGLKGLG